MKAGSTQRIVVKLNIEKSVDTVIFTLKSQKYTHTVEIANADEFSGIFPIDLTQEVTERLVGVVKIEAQVNYADKSVDKSEILTKYVYDTLATQYIDGNAPSGDEKAIELVLGKIEGEVALIITPNSSDQLINEVSQLFSETKAIAEDVQTRANNGEFDGKDYILTDKDKQDIAELVEGSSGGTTNYDDLKNKPQINNIELIGVKSLDELGIQSKGNYATIEQLSGKINLYTGEEAPSSNIEDYKDFAEPSLYFRTRRKCLYTLFPAGNAVVAVEHVNADIVYTKTETDSVIDEKITEAMNGIALAEESEF